MNIIIILFLIGLAIFIIMNKPKWKGNFSEKLVYKKMMGLPDDYMIFNDLLFKSNGRTTQIDHVVVSPYGVFVIETKGYKGWILGGEYSEYWTQSLYKNKYQFYNPIKQNEGHVKFLRYLLQCSVDIPFIPIVVFDNSADLKVYVHDHIVINRFNLKRAILHYKTPVLDKTTVDWIIKTIHQNQIIANKNDLKQHTQNVKRQQYESKMHIKNGICPRCGGQLIRRKGKFGFFYGCSNYPNCTFTQKL